MTDKPILFSGGMVRAILDGRKTQTRRVVKPQPERGNTGWTHWHHKGVQISDQNVNHRPFEKAFPGLLQDSGLRYLCPYGCPGDLLWVRETWAASHAYDRLPPRLIPPGARIHYAASEERGGLVWRPSIHMPRWASRITLLLTDVRVERVQEITAADISAEGIDIRDAENRFRLAEPADFDACAFAELWDSINAARGYGWSENPWVWALTFRLILANVNTVRAHLGRYGIREV